MHSFQPSRGKILFEVFCALAISASCAGAWLQTNASALLPAAAVAALYGIVHLFDLRRRTPTEAVEPQRIEFETEVQASEAPMPAAESQGTIEEAVQETEPVEPTAARASATRRTKASRKNGSRRAGAPKAAKLVEIGPPEEVDVMEVEPPEQLDVVEPEPCEEAHHAPLAPLFEPEPFARQQRAVFGRKAG